MSSKENWIDQAKIELNGKDPKEFLSKNHSEVTIEPYYDASDSLPNTEILYEKEAIPFHGPNGWLNLPSIKNFTDDKANTLALQHLQCGADGIFFQIDESSNVEKLVKEIEPEYCFLGFEANEAALKFFKELVQHFSFGPLHGTFVRSDLTFPLGRSMQNDLLAMANLFKGYKKFRCHGLVVKDGNETMEIALVMQTVLAIVDELTDYGFHAQSVFEQISFSMNSSSNFFLDVAKIRSLKILMKRLADAYQVQSTPTFIRVVCATDVTENYQPHGSLLSNSFSALAAAFASAEAITIITDSPNSDRHVQTARNVSLLLREEAKLDKVIDPLAGSFFVEQLTYMLVEKAWATIIEKK